MAHRTTVCAQDAVLITLLGSIVAAVGTWRPSFWYDELATLSVSLRSRADLDRVLGNVDVVHGLYYVSMRYWFGLFGASEFSARLPSALAVGVAAGGVVVLGQRLGSRRLGLLAGVVFLLLPRVTWAAVEARSYAPSAAAAVWLTVLLLVACRSGRLRWWAVYAAVLALSVVLFLYTVALIPAHLIAVALRGDLRGRGLAWLGAALTGFVAASPLVLEAFAQAGQTSWIPPLDRNLPRIIWEYQWFVGAPWFAVAFTVLITGGVAVRPEAKVAPQRRGVLTTAVPWILVPMVMLGGYSLVASPVYLDRYLTFTTPAVALIGAAAIMAVAVRTWAIAGVTGALVLLTVPSFVEQRSEWSDPSGMDFSTVNDYVAGRLEPGDCVLFGGAAWNPASQRLVSTARPETFAGTRDLGLGRTAAVEGWLWDENLPFQAVAGRLPTCEVVWFFADAERMTEQRIYHTSNQWWTLPPHRFEWTPEYAGLVNAGFRMDERQQFNVSQAIRFVR
ncbi:glycosyltransferase family 39 protein [Rhodococcus chondri]|uniref:Glycosyltransferase family 39 protein n=1 Tax=Rhodococcus chondri TaxID=3065941 RepID=A0ABU7JMA2_9NOCA|nr:glycosyltransferase family 39 protein [Rhodococcus sp. CC-R104]MEE2031163.1 glycosyltransferase family 39 protein [Rhodococcus sp. CC-R104]